MFVYFVIAAIILLGYFFIGRYLFSRKLKIKEKRMSPFSKDRNKWFVITEILIVIASAIGVIVYISIANPPSTAFAPKFLCVLYFFVQAFRGIELWVSSREDKSYYYQLLGAGMFLVLFLAISFLENRKF